MRKALKIILPLVLILVLLIAAYWFFFQYRKDITAGLCVSIGDGQAEAEKYDGAVTWYGYANKLTPEDTEIALKLANAYRAKGNYTKTEYVLVNAIYASPDCAELYAALSEVYVAQDKLRDAQVMLDQIRSEAVLAELNAKRPAPPVITPEGGYYSDYITVALEPAGDEACYLTTGGDYPSLVRDLYTEPLTLSAGETTVCAVAVSADGLVSPAVYAGYTVAGVIEEAVFTDPAMKTYIQQLLNRGDRSLRTDDLWGITELTVPEGVTSLDDLRFFTGLTSLTLHDLCGSDLAILSTLPALKVLDLSGCALTTEQLTSVCRCRQLEVLRLSGCGLSNITPLAELPVLRELDLSDNSVNNLAPIADSATLQVLYLQQNALISLSGLTKLTALRTLDVSHNALKSIAPLSVCTQMESLNVAYNQLTDVRAVASMTELRSFDGSDNQVEDVSAFSACTKIQLFTMKDNLIKTIDCFDGMSEIREINIDYNDVEAVPAFAPDCKIVVFSASHNFLEDLSGLAGLPYLNYVNADYNNIRDIQVLKTCPNLTQVNVFGTYIDEGGELEEMGVIVNYTPNMRD